MTRVVTKRRQKALKFGGYQDRSENQRCERKRRRKREKAKSDGKRANKIEKGSEEAAAAKEEPS